ncbi:class I SAM-dependent methyltransferase [Acinetobacter sp. B5B]|uniref:class I SAM-dependent methyltransferase n=1 Tax=Acinetobacter baretiae TaxID=2605383 RepID=UPI0018C241CD|nr:class I SAM-dependent methyltransferase [Acinetobacter baretiae]MBF7683633.1 class I SAM-dependent methyltransferase [Acinetobacter baretiae]MBF7686072.1 class I SAM-dependent methyltransferase [Acinetobacter baretiae]
MKTQQHINQQQYKNKEINYLNSQNHAQGIEFDKIKKVIKNHDVAPTVLDLGCGAGHVSYHVAELCQHIVAYDLSENMLDIVETTAVERKIKNIQTQQGSAEQLPFEDHSFDIVITRFSAHHWQDVQQAIQQVYRVLKPQGVFIVVDSIGSNQPILDTFIQSIELLRDPSHVRNYSMAQWLNLTECHGLMPLKVEKQALKIRLDDWVKRMHTPDMAIQAIRYLQSMACHLVVSHFDIQDSGDFQLDVGYMVFKKQF